MTLLASSPKLHGLILAGGKSSRMQQPKAHLVIHDVPQWQYLEQVLQPHCNDIFFSVSPQLKPAIARERRLLIDDVFTEPFGPLGGIISTMRKHPLAAFFVLACDLPHFNSDAARYLSERRNPQAHATVFVHDGKIEPLCAIYEPSIKGELARAWAEDRLCPQKILAALDVERVAVQDSSWITNLNHPEDLASLKKRKDCRTVTVQYYATLREQAGRSEETLRTTKTTVGELFLELKARYGFAMEPSRLRYAVNQRIVPSHEALGDPAHVVFIPPVSGG